MNRATREKKAAAKAAKQAYSVHRTSPYYVDQSIYSMPYMAGPGPIRGTHVPPRRSYSTPGMTLSPYSPMPAAPSMASPAQFEAPWFTGLPVPVINVSPMPPSIAVHAHHVEVPPHEQGLDEVSHYPASYSTTPVSPTESSTSTSYAMPMTPVRKPMLHTPPHTPATAYFQTPNVLTYTPQQFPFSPSPLQQQQQQLQQQQQQNHQTFSASPTLCPGLPVYPGQKQPQQPLVGLGIGIAGQDDPSLYTGGNEYLSASNAWTQPEQHYF